MENLADNSDPSLQILDSGMQLWLSEGEDVSVPPCSQEAKKQDKSLRRKRSSLFSSLFRRKRNHRIEPQKESEDRETEGSPKKRLCVEKSALGPSVVLRQILEETKRHNEAVEKHNAALLHSYADIVKEVVKKTALLKQALDQK